MLAWRIRARGERGASEGSAGAWAAAAVVLGLGGLLFGVVAQLRISSLESEIAELRAEVSATADVSTDDGGDPEGTSVASTTTTTSGRQPDDPSAAREGVIEAYTVVYDGSAGQDDRLALIDDPDSVEVAMQFAAGGDVGDQFSSTRARVDDVTFTSAGDATVRYRVLVDGVPTLQARIGAAVLDGETWKVTRDTVCADLQEVGAPCDI